MYDLVIIGGGPAGVAAGVYAARKKLKTLLIAEAIGGQSTDSPDVQNWIGTPHISGAAMAKQMEAHLREYASDMLQINLGERADKVEAAGDPFSVHTTKSIYPAKTVLITTGGSRKKLDAKGAAEFENKGVTYCASCDGPLFSGMDIAVVGGGNAGFETALQLLAYAKSVTLLHRHKELKADAITIERVCAHEHMRVIKNVEPTEVTGEQFVTGLKYTDKDSGEIKELAVSGIFVEAGVLPNTDFAEGLLELDAVKRIKVDPKNQRTNIEGIWAAGDATDELYHQNNIAAGDGVKALEDIYLWLKKQ